MDLSGKRALVTGGARRVGAAISKALSEAGARVAIHCHDSIDAARELGAQCPGSVVVEADLADRAARDAIIPELTRVMGGIRDVVGILGIDRCKAVLRKPFPPFSESGTTPLHLALHGSLLCAQFPELQESKEWWTAAVQHLLAAQVPSPKKGATHAAGSWAPARDPFGYFGGRVYSTSMAVLALQATTRFPRYDKMR